MKNTFLFRIVLGAGLAIVPLQVTKADLLLYYNFDGLTLGAASDGQSITNFGTLGTNGVLHTGTDAGNVTTVVTSGIPVGSAPAGAGNALSLAAANPDLGGAAAANIDTGFTVSALNITPSTAYTVMAWANFANQTNDNMIFGGDPGANGGNTQLLHLGARGNQYWSGQWNDDIQSNGTTNPTDPGNWHHVAYENAGASGVQTIFVDGVQVAQGAGNGTAGTMSLTANLVLATSFDSGSFNGLLDEVKVYNTELTQAEVQQAMQVVPEPTSLALMALSGLGTTFLLRRRRAAH
jgi:Concanavalin A-like lectin/glucanases superfamily/PEP-CTERM motif